MLGHQIGMLAQPVAGAFDLDNDGVVEQPIKQGGGDDGIAKDLSPLGKAAVGGQDHRALFVAGIDELKEEITAAVHDRQITDLVDDEQRGAAEPADALAQLTLTLGLGEGADDVGKGGEVDAAPSLDGLDAERHGKMRFAGARRPEKVDNLAPVDELELRQGQYALAIE